MGAYVNEEMLVRLTQSDQAGPCEYRDRCERYKLITKAMGNPALISTQIERLRIMQEDCNVSRGQCCDEKLKFKGSR